MLDDPEKLIHQLRTGRGSDFERAVKDAFTFLWLRSELVGTGEAESDVVAEAPDAANPYFVVVEWSAVGDESQVGYEKIGQLRGNFTGYMDSRRQIRFKSAYKLVVGKPIFSKNAKQRALPDVGLLTVDRLAEILQAHYRYHLTQDELESVFRTVGEVLPEHIRALEEPYRRKLSIYALILVALTGKTYTPKQQIAGEVLAYSKLFRVTGVTSSEVTESIRDLSGPFANFVAIRGDEIRLVGIPMDAMPGFEGGFGTQLKQFFDAYMARLERMQRV